MKHLAIVKLWALGDIVMATPMLQAVHAAHPGCRVTWIANKTWAPALEEHPLIAEVIALDIDAWRGLWRGGRFAAWGRETARIRRDLRARGFDALIHCHPEKWWMAFLAVAPRRVALFHGAVPRWARAAYTDVVTYAPGAHETDFYLGATRHLGIPDAGHALSVAEPSAGKAYADAFLARHAPGHCGPVVLLAPLATADNRCWEPERYAEIIRWLWRERGAVVVLSCAGKDAEKIRPIVELSGVCPILADGTTVPEYVALIARADLVVCADSSAMHLAAATGTPFIALFGATPVECRAPRKSGVGGTALFHPLPCAPCDRSTCANPEFRACMKQITVAEVKSAIDGYLTGTGARA